MWRVLVSSLLVSLAAGQRSGFSSSLDIADGYLPPSNPDNPVPVSVRCEQPKTIFLTKTTVITKTVERKKLVTVPQVVQRSSTVTKVVPTTIYVTSVSQVRSPVVRRETATTIIQRVVTKTVDVPGKTSVQIKTDYQSKVSYKTLTKVVTLTTTLYRSVTQFKTEVQRVTKTVLKTVPQVTYVTKTELLPGGTKYVTKTEQRLTTVVKQYQPPAYTTVQKEVQYHTSFALRQIPGPVITKVRDVVKTEVVQSVRVQQVPQDITSVVQVTKQVVQKVTKIQPVTLTKTEYVTKTNVMPVFETKIVERLVTVPLQLTKTVTVVRKVPGPTIVRSIVKTETKSLTVRGPDRVVTSYKTVDRVQSRFVTTTVIKPSSVIKVVTKTEPCGGYNYDTPRNPLQF